VLIAFNKPYGVITQFSPSGSNHRTLAEFGFPKNVYPIGRLDTDSEGLLLLSDEPEWNQRLLHPKQAHQRTYWAQVERIPTVESLLKLEKGIDLNDFHTLPCKAHILDPQPPIPPRNPPIRFRKNVPDCWMELILIEGKNRQVRRMTAAIGHPTLRLIRVQIGGFGLEQLPAGSWKILNNRERELVL
jgi:23S rRNA pseudouridine2457 synthase